MSLTIHIQDYTYDLPDDKIAIHPLPDRSQSKLLVYSGGKIEHRAFKNILDYLPSNACLFFNDTRVIPARLHFQKDTGAEIEIFLLAPLQPSTIMADVMTSTHMCSWQCTVGNLKRWKDGQILSKGIPAGVLHASLIDREKNIVEFTWDTHQSFGEIITLIGATPLPPYIKREASKEDINRYQTVYSHFEGAVAAPTAGLHFTDAIMESLEKKGMKKEFLTLHVSAGTFQPVKAENALDHTMHHEQIMITKKTIENLLETDQTIVAVGTTSMRTLESLYWYGAKLMNNPDEPFIVTQHDPYTRSEFPSKEKSLQTILSFMEKHDLKYLTGTTSIFIYPGYTFRICQALITNFHLPASTLILLVAAFIGDNWREVYKEALRNDYRFLSYGDSSLLIP